MCFMTKRPDVLPHEWNSDFPHLMLRHRAAKLKHGEHALSFGEAQLTQMDRKARWLSRTAAGHTGLRTARTS